ncbi:MAG: OsmC family protein [Candidatus Methanodesulfokora sp.]|jgi:putative redox protein
MPQIKGKVVFEGDMRFRASTDRFSMEMSEDGLRPMEAVLLATGACTAMDVVAIIRKAGYEVQSLELELEADREERHPKVFQGDKNSLQDKREHAGGACQEGNRDVSE